MVESLEQRKQNYQTMLANNNVLCADRSPQQPKFSRSHLQIALSAFSNPWIAVK